VAKFARHFNRPPDQLGLAEVRVYQIHLTSTGTSWAAFNVAVSALRFFYGVTLGRAAMVERIPYARKQQQLPVILSADEVVPGLKNRTALMTAYAAGLRVSEVVGLRVADIDSDRMLIRVEQGKGHRDRYLMLSAQLLVILRAYWQEARPKTLAVPGPQREAATRREHAPRGVPECPQNGEARQARERPYPAPQLCHPSARNRNRYPHDPGAARQHLSTTARYTQVATTTIGNTTSPFDRLDLAKATPD
jgi:integrase/recombinase XerD